MGNGTPAVHRKSDFPEAGAAMIDYSPALIESRFSCFKTQDMRLVLLGLRALFTVIGGLCLAIPMVMLLAYFSGNQVQTVEQRYYYLWFIAFLAGGIVSMIVAALLSDWLRKLPNDRP